MTATLITAAHAMYASLRSLPCRCAYNVPYAECKVERKLTAECTRCVSMRLWDEANKKTEGEGK